MLAFHVILGSFDEDICLDLLCYFFKMYCSRLDFQLLDGFFKISTMRVCNSFMSWIGALFNVLVMKLYDSFRFSIVMLSFVVSAFVIKCFTQASRFSTRIQGLPSFLMLHSVNLCGPIAPEKKRFELCGQGLDSEWSPIVFARLDTTYAVPGLSRSHVNGPMSAMMCATVSELSNPASKPWNLWTVVAQAVTRGQYLA